MHVRVYVCMYLCVYIACAKGHESTALVLWNVVELLLVMGADPNTVDKVR